MSPPDPITCRCPRCKSQQNFSPVSETTYISSLQGGSLFLSYVCRNCKTSHKRYAVTVYANDQEAAATVYKIGEEPSFNIDVSDDLRELLRPDADLLNKALQCEGASLGIGAFVYYRRILDEMKGRIFDEVRNVAQQINAGDEALQWIETARNDRQFTKSLGEIKSAGLHAIYMDGHNPLTLLYDEISEGVHAGSDVENLVIAQRIRIVLGHLAGRLAALKLEQQEVKAALHEMLQAKKAREERRTNRAAVTGPSPSNGA